MERARPFCILLRVAQQSSRQGEILLTQAEKPTCNYGENNIGNIANRKRKLWGLYQCRSADKVGMAQAERTNRFFVTNTTVSKWERDLSYLDIALATDIYRELS
ncbi:MAG: hypothetical protein PHU30_06145, partial [Oscillospiraceae bacterium]|nr:hypothetical protein [Oscillospiraceae bacterium]